MVQCFVLENLKLIMLKALGIVNALLDRDS